MRRFHNPPAIDDIVDLAVQALPALPEALRTLVRGAAVVVEEVADETTALELGFESPWALTGRYCRSTPMGRHTITLYRGPILLEWIDTGEDLFRLVRNVLVQEIAHHFGLSDADVGRMEGEG